MRAIRSDFVVLFAVSALTLVTFSTLSQARADGQTEQQEVQQDHDQAIATLGTNTHDIKVDGVGEETLVTAGSGKFNALWTRDFSYASLGLLSAGVTKPVHDGLDVLLHFQRADGLVPRRIGDVSNVWQGVLDHLGFKHKTPTEFKKVEYKTGLGAESIDSNSLVAWNLANYVEVSNDLDFARQNWPKMLKAFEWLRAKEFGGLLKQTDFADWKDVTERHGIVMYSNALYYRGLKAMGDLAAQLGDKDNAEYFSTKADYTLELIRSQFWDAKLGFFRDTLNGDDTRFSLDGNLFGVLFGIADEQQAEQIFENADQKMVNPKLGLYILVDRPYENVPFLIKLADIRGYSDSSWVWPWLTALYAAAAMKYPTPANEARAQHALQVLSDNIKQYGFQECFETNGQLVNRWAHKSEPNFSWFAGLMGYATEVYLDQNKTPAPGSVILQ